MELFKLLGTIAVENDSANSAIDETTGKAETSSNRMQSAFKKIGGVIATVFAVDKIKDFGVAIVNASAEVAAEEAAFTQIMGKYSDEASEKINKIAEATGMVSSRLTPYMTSMTAKFKGLGYDVDEATDLASTGLNIAADAAAFWDKSLDDSMSALNSFVNGNYEGGEAIGLFANETTLATWASENLGLEWKNLTEKEKQFARLQFAKSMQEASGATGQASKEADAYANVQGNLNEAWRQFKAQIGEPILQNLVIPAMKWLGDFITNKLSPAFEQLKEKLKEAKQWFIENEDKIKAVGIAVGVLATAFVGLKVGMIIQNIANAFGSAQKAIAEYTLKLLAANMTGQVSNATLSTKNILLGVLSGQMSITTAATMLWQKAQTKLNTALTANPIGIVVAAIAALIAIFVVAYNKSDAFKAIVDKLWATIKNNLMKVFEELKPYIDEIVVALSELWAVIQEELLPIILEIVEVVIALWTELQPIFEEVLKVVMGLFSSILNVIKQVMPYIVDTIKNALTVIKNVITLVTSLIKGDWNGVWNSIKNIFGTVWNQIKNTAKTVWNGIKSLFSSTWNGIKSTASNVVNGIKTTFSNAWTSIKNKTSSIWNNIKNAITKPIKDAKDKVTGWIDNIKQAFNNFKAKIKMPHIKIENASWNPKDWIENGIPKFKVEWYKKGAILNEPTVFDYNPSTQTAKVGGEAGAEAVAPIDTLMGYVQAAVRSETGGMNVVLYQILDLLSSFFPTMINKSNKQIILSNGVLVGELIDDIDEQLGNKYSGRGRGR